MCRDEHAGRIRPGPYAACGNPRDARIAVPPRASQWRIGMCRFFLASFLFDEEAYLSFFP
jgi:hypothetical protein